jgi:hypothetical protein
LKNDEFFRITKNDVIHAKHAFLEKLSGRDSSLRSEWQPGVVCFFGEDLWTGFFAPRRVTAEGG